MLTAETWFNKLVTIFTSEDAAIRVCFNACLALRRATAVPVNVNSEKLEPVYATSVQFHVGCCERHTVLLVPPHM